MKTIFAFIVVALSLAPHTSVGQDIYYVLNVKGKVTHERTRVLLKINDQIAVKDALVFSSLTDAVVVISSKSGRMILRPKPVAKSSELVCVVSDILNPGTGRLSARSGGISNAIEMKNYFGQDSLHILGSCKTWVAPTAYPMNSSNFFFIRYSWRGQVINKKLSHDQDSLHLNPLEIYKVDGIAISQKEVRDAKLFYKNSTSTTEVTRFAVLFPEESAVTQLVKSFQLHSALKGKPFIDELIPLLKDTYGKTDPDNVRVWVRKNLGPY